MILDASEREFYLRAEGQEINTLPDVPIFAMPMGKTSLWNFGYASSPTWALRVRHSCYRGFKKRPKFILSAIGGRKNMSLMFRLPARPLYRYFSDVANDLTANLATGINLDHVALYGAGTAIPEPDEMDFLIQTNQRRADRLRSMPAIKRDIRSHNQWASTEYEMNKLMTRIERAGGR